LDKGEDYDTVSMKIHELMRKISFTIESNDKVSLKIRKIETLINELKYKLKFNNLT